MKVLQRLASNHFQMEKLWKAILCRRTTDSSENFTAADMKGKASGNRSFQNIQNVDAGTSTVEISK
jgi:hypothetical protein